MRESTFYICIRFLDKSLNKFRLISIIIINPKTLRRIREFREGNKRMKWNNSSFKQLKNDLFQKPLRGQAYIIVNRAHEKFQSRKLQRRNIGIIELQSEGLKKKKKNQKQRSPVNWFRKAIERGAKIISPPWKNKEQAARPAFSIIWFERNFAYLFESSSKIRSEIQVPAPPISNIQFSRGRGGRGLSTRALDEREKRHSSRIIKQKHRLVFGRDRARNVAGLIILGGNTGRSPSSKGWLRESNV